MSESTSTRTHRSCLLVVGHDLMTEQLEDVLHQPPRRVQNLFEAMGELTVAPARQPIAAALISDALLQDAHADGEAIDALRRIDPSVRLVRAYQPDSAWTGAVEGVDAAVEWPAEIDDLAEVLGEELVDVEQVKQRQTMNAPPVSIEEVRKHASPSAAVDEISEASSPAESLEPACPGESEETAEEDAATRTTHAGAGAGSPGRPSTWGRSDSIPAFETPGLWTSRSSGEPATSLAQHAPLPAGDLPPPDAELSLMDLTGEDGRNEHERLRTPPVLTEDLGDTDLVKAVVHDPRGVRAIAVALLRQQTGWKDVQLINKDDHVPDGATCIDVQRGDRTYGRLVSTDVTAAELRPWGQWLSHWLMLDEAYRTYRLSAYRDELTGAWNRRYFHRFMMELIAEARERRRQVSVMVFDIDEFKRFNDEFSHAAGDVILVETVALLNSVIRRCDRVCRIGGDEFAVVFADLDAPRAAGSSHPGSVELIVRRFQQQICRMRFPKLGLEAPGNLSISAGLASYPWDGNDPEELLQLADRRALESKRKGKNHITFGPIAAEPCEEQ